MYKVITTSWARIPDEKSHISTNTAPRGSNFVLVRIPGVYQYPISASFSQIAVLVSFRDLHPKRAKRAEVVVEKWKNTGALPPYMQSQTSLTSVSHYIFRFGKSSRSSFFHNKQSDLDRNFLRTRHLLHAN